MKHHFLHADSPVIRVAYEQSARCQDPSWKPYADSAKHMCGSYEPITHSQSFRPLPAPCILRVNTFCEKKKANGRRGGRGQGEAVCIIPEGGYTSMGPKAEPKKTKAELRAEVSVECPHVHT